MKKQLEQDRQKLINNIQNHLQILRQKRKVLQQAKAICYNENIENDYQISSSSNNNQKYTRIQLNKEKQDNAQKIKNLEVLYNKKRQLQSAGIRVQSLDQITKYQNDQKMRKKLQKCKQKQAIQNQRKNIIEEELKNTKQFLKTKNIITKQTKQLQIMNYRKLFKGKQQQLKQYERLLYQKNLSRIQKQQIISTSFYLICDWNKIVRKKYVKDFLVANPQFCTKFYITAADIKRDLQVFQTRQEGYMDQLEFYEYIKSNEIMNPLIKPSLKQKNKQKQVISTQKINENIMNKLSQTNSVNFPNRQLQRKYCEYLRRIIKQLDKFNEGIVERMKYIGYLQKGWKIQKEQYISKQILGKFVQFIKKQTKKSRQSKYFKELQTKFISYDKVQYLFKVFVKLIAQQQQQKKKKKDKQVIGIVKQTIQHNIKDQQQSEPQIQQDTEKPKQLNDFQKYGWGPNETSQIKLNQLDAYYNKVTQKYAPQIQWNGFREYRADFRQLQAFIEQQDAKIKQQSKINHR